MMHIYDILITYDISTNSDSKVYGAIKEAMIAKGYADRFTHPESGRVMYLPNTTIWKKNQSPKLALQDLLDVVDNYNSQNGTKHKVERCISSRFDDYWAVYGEPYQSKRPAPIKTSYGKGI